MPSQKSEGQPAPKAGLTSFAPLPELPSVFVARNKQLSAFALVLKSGEVCVVSPVRGLTDQARESLSAIGSVRFLFTPNHYHNLALEEYSAAYPNAGLIAPAGAIPRLEEVTGLSFSTPNELVAEMQDTMSLLAPEGLKTGENWVRVKSQDSTAWIVGDAFCGADMYGDAVGPELLKPFPTYGLGDKDQYLP